MKHNLSLAQLYRNIKNLTPNCLEEDFHLLMWKCQDA